MFSGVVAGVWRTLANWSATSNQVRLGSQVAVFLTPGLMMETGWNHQILSMVLRAFTTIVEVEAVNDVAAINNV